MYKNKCSGYLLISRKKMAIRGKPFTDEKFIKECLQCANDMVCPSKSENILKGKLKGTALKK